ncbi:ABC-2 transporter permease [bacterium]|nr:ABC-2 transporter permease [bacterium]
MIQLIKNDLSTGRYYLIMVYLYILFLISAMITALVKDTGGMLAGIFLFVFIAVSGASGFIAPLVDSTGKGDVLRVSLPVRRYTLVLARYISSFIVAVAACMTGFAVIFTAVTLFHIDDPVLHLLLSVRGMTGLTAAVLLLISYGLPFWFKYAELNPIFRALVAPGVLLLCIQGAGQLRAVRNGALQRIMELLTLVQNNVRDWIFGMGVSHPLNTVLAVLCAIVLLSLGSSIVFYRKRDI